MFWFFFHSFFFNSTDRNISHRWWAKFSGVYGDGGKRTSSQISLSGRHRNFSYLVSSRRCCILLCILLPTKTNLDNNINSLAQTQVELSIFQFFYTAIRFLFECLYTYTYLFKCYPTSLCQTLQVAVLLFFFSLYRNSSLKLFYNCMVCRLFTFYHLKYGYNRLSYINFINVKIKMIN